MKIKVLVVDDSIYMRSLIVEALEGERFEIVGQASTGESAIDMAIELQPDLITLDNVLPDMIGLDILKVLKEEEELSTQIIMVSAVGQESVIQQGLEFGAKAYIVKPFTSSQLLEEIDKILPA